MNWIRGTRGPGLSRAVELSTILRLLGCSPGDKVLDIGGAQRFSTRLMTRLGYMSRAACLSGGRSGRAGRARHVPEAARRLPYPDAYFDGVIGAGALDRLDSLLGELSRVIGPGARVVVSRARDAAGPPGLPDAVAAAARAHGFRPIAPGAAHESVDHEEEASCVVLVGAGERLANSRQPGALRSLVVVKKRPATVARNQPFVVRTEVHNTGTTVWLREPSRFGGAVTITGKLLTVAGHAVPGSLRRRRLKADVRPGQRTEAALQFRVPMAIPPGQYAIAIGVTNELQGEVAELDSTSASLVPVNVTA